MAFSTNHSLGHFPIFIQRNAMQRQSHNFTVLNTPAIKDLKGIASTRITKPREKQNTTFYV